MIELRTRSPFASVEVREDPAPRAGEAGSTGSRIPDTEPTTHAERIEMLREAPRLIGGALVFTGGTLAILAIAAAWWVTRPIDILTTRIAHRKDPSS